MNKHNFEKLSKQLRDSIIDISYLKKTHHVGSCLSCVEILIFIFFNFLNFNKSKKEKNDFFILSKGHAALAYYIVLMMKKFFSKKFLLKNYISNGGLLGGHPDKNSSIGIDYCSGSLGNGLSVASGVALSYLKDNIKKKVLVVLGDGECNEGMVWESALFAGHNKINNLYVIIDYNRQQGFGKTDDVLSLDSLKSKFLSFNWNVLEIDGHKFSEFKRLKKLIIKKNNKPNLIIANTIKGKGIPFYENKFESHYKILSKKEYMKLRV